MDTVPRAFRSIRSLFAVRDALHVTVIVSSVLFAFSRFFSWNSSFS